MTADQAWADVVAVQRRYLRRHPHSITVCEAHTLIAARRALRAEIERATFAEIHHATRHDQLVELLAILPEGDESIAVLIEQLHGERRERALDLVELLGLRNRTRNQP